MAMEFQRSNIRTSTQARSRVPFVEFSTDSQPAERRVRYWETANRETILPIVPEVHDPNNFRGRIRNWRIADVSISNISAAPCRYRRDRQAIASDTEKYALISFAVGSTYEVNQSKLELTFDDGSFVVQQTDSPYSFLQHDSGDIWVLRVPQMLLSGRVGPLDRFSSQVFDARRGLGALLFTTVREFPFAAAEVDPSMHEGLASHLVELLALALEADDRVLVSQTGTVQNAHLARVQRFVRANINNADLSPAAVAAGCGISVRYLHALFRPAGMTLGQWVREQRLLGSQRDLANPRCVKGIAEIAYSWGFGDHAQFCRAFKERFGLTPSQSREEANISRRPAAD